MAERLQKVMARAGLGSRRSCEALIEQGHVRVNGKRAELGQTVGPKDKILVRGEPIASPEPIYVMLNKPPGIITTMHDPKGRPCVAQLVPSYPGIHAVGRLDKDTTGLLICTTDGELTQLLTHPKHEVRKTYLVVTSGTVTESDIKSMTNGVTLDDGVAVADQAKIVAQHPTAAVVEINIHSGRNRVVRRMFEKLGLEVRELKRTAVGPLELGRLKPGDWRDLTPDEVGRLKRSATNAP